MPRVRLLYELVHPSDSRSSLTARYAAMLDQIEYGDRHGFSYVRLHEHHGVENNYLSSPVAVAAAVAARTRTIRIRSLVLVLLYDLVKLAEDIAVVDILSGGRYEVLLGAGYRPEEFEMFGRSMTDQRRRVDEAAIFLRKALRGKPFEHEERMIHVTPSPARRPNPPIMLAGGTEAAARSAARLADGFEPNVPLWWDIYRDERLKLGLHDPGPLPGSGPTFLHITEDPERDWRAIAPRITMMVRNYREWAQNLPRTTTNSFANASAEITFGADPNYQVVTPDQAIAILAHLGSDDKLDLNPMWGGIEPDLAWSSLELLVQRVLPQLPMPTEREVASDPHPLVV
jgi:alkanesulfonate monooxygenase SsuD/methylene tetrahydromethanopterin reductase-like flavin-dependent oxidoreductase (luciferase family)